MIRLYHATPIENMSSIIENGLKSGTEINSTTLKGRKKPFLTKTNNGNVVDVRNLIPFAISLENQALMRVPRKVIFEYELDENKDEYVFSTDVSTSTKTYFHQKIKAEKINNQRSEILLTKIDRARLKIHRQRLDRSSDCAGHSVMVGTAMPSGTGTINKILLPEYVPSPEMKSDLAGIYKSVYSFFKGFEFGVHGHSVSAYVFDGDRSLRFMRARNSDGWNVYIRPLVDLEPFFVLLDDVNQSFVENIIKGAKYDNKMVVRTSPQNWQVWLRFSESLTISQKMALINMCHADLAAHPNRRWGRAPGFTNRKEKYGNSEGKYPWVSLEYCKY